jgi:hypothetical protein
VPTNYPGSLDGEPQLPTSTIVDGVTPGHDTHHPTVHGAIQALEVKAGPGSSTPVTLGHVFQVLSTGPVITGWGASPAGTPASTVVAPTTFSTSSTVGVATPYAREDHSHGLPGAVKEIIFTFDTVTSPTTGTYKYRMLRSATLRSMRCSLGTVAAAGAACTVDLRKNGSTMITSGKPSIAVGQAINTNGQTYATVAFAADDLVSVNIDTGSDGAQLMVIIEYQENTP